MPGWYYPTKFEHYQHDRDHGPWIICRHAGTFATAGGGAETFAAGDRLAIINQNPADATLADLSITFLGKRT
jgi:hypothetical protein